MNLTQQVFICILVKRQYRRVPTRIRPSVKGEEVPMGSNEIASGCEVQHFVL